MNHGAQNTFAKRKPRPSVMRLFYACATFGRGCDGYKTRATGEEVRRSLPGFEPPAAYRLGRQSSQKGVKVKASQTTKGAQRPLPSPVNPAVVAEIARREREGDPIFTQSLLAVGEDDHYEHHEAPQKALLALADIFHSHDNATFQARRHGVQLDDFATVQPGHMAYLLQVIARGMKMDPCCLSAAQTLLQAREQARTEGAQQ